MGGRAVQFADLRHLLAVVAPLRPDSIGFAVAVVVAAAPVAAVPGMLPLPPVIPPPSSSGIYPPRFPLVEVAPRQAASCHSHRRRALLSPSTRTPRSRSCPGSVQGRQCQWGGSCGVSNGDAPCRVGCCADAPQWCPPMGRCCTGCLWLPLCRRRRMDVLSGEPCSSGHSSGSPPCRQ